MRTKEELARFIHRNDSMAASCDWDKEDDEARWIYMDLAEKILAFLGPCERCGELEAIIQDTAREAMRINESWRLRAMELNLRFDPPATPPPEEKG